MIHKPYRRIIRPFTLFDELSEQIEYSLPGSGDSYILDDEYATDRITLVRAYHTIERDLNRLFEYVEPADGNLQTYSHRVFELLLRGSTEFEANCKAILQANRYEKAGNWNITDYYKIDASSRLSEYEVRLSVWRGGCKVLRPFGDWSTGTSLSWYQDYNSVKHNRSKCFELANLHNALLATCGTLATLFSQFYIACLRPHGSVAMYQQDDGWFSHENTVFAIKPPQGWTNDQCYDFDWSDIREHADRFSVYGY